MNFLTTLILWILFFPFYVAILLALGIFEGILDAIKLGATVRQVRIWWQTLPAVVIPK